VDAATAGEMLDLVDVLRAIQDRGKTIVYTTHCPLRTLGRWSARTMSARTTCR
jgi:hypothetical protein